MKQDRSISRIVTPSYFSFMTGFILTAYIAATNVWSTVASYPIFSQLSSVLDENTLLLSDQGNTFSYLTDAFLNTSVFDNVFYLLAWAIVGLLVYIGFMILTRGIQHFEDFVQITSAVNVSRLVFLKELFFRIIARLVFATICLVFLIFFLQILLPVASLSFRAGAPATTLEHWRYLLSATAILILSFHLSTIFLRLLFFRIRVFGGSDELVINQ